uniref:Short-chain dehydrogenase/reductase family protein n=1 Tax=Mycena chlorophos TaxID=658473 RepID=A0ABQ0KZY8_MYCCL|nr:short-chain dehydrogenase/reductase family protein [Mycena chlorophos]
MSALPTFAFESTAEEVATALADNIKGKNVLITGTSLNGIGFEAARVIAKHANLVVITGYNAERLKLSEDAIKKDTPSANVRRLTLDLSSLAAVRKAATEVNNYPEPIDVVIHNAAAAVAGFKLSADGYESQIATGHLGPFLFTKLIAPKLLAAKSTPRVIYVSSGAHAFGPGVTLDLLRKPDETKYTPVGAYAETKAAEILTAIELSRRSGGKILGFSLHPGVILTNINTAQDSIPVMQSIGIITADGKPNTKDWQWKTMAQGAATTVAAAFDPRIASSPGAYLDDSKIATDTVAEHSKDPVAAQKLWDATEEILGEKFEF